MTLPVPYIWPLAVGLTFAICYDLGRRRIPNLVCAFVFVSGLIARGLNQGTIGVLSGGAAAVLFLALLYRPWRAGGIGGGDVKLAAATASWIAPAQLIWFALVTALAGGVVALVCYVLARAPARAEVRTNLTLAVLHQEMPVVPSPSHRLGHPSVPYALAIAAGAMFALLRG